MALTAIQTYEADGLIEARGLLTEGEVVQLRDEFETLRATGAARTQQVLYVHEAPNEARPTFDVLMDQWMNPHLRVAAGTRAILQRLGLVFTAMLGEELVPFQDVLVSKHSGHKPFPWHQDEPFWPVETPGGVVVWCALDAVDRTNGGVEFAVGSHRLGLGPAIDLHTGEPQRGTSGSVPELAVLEHRCLTMVSGDAALFHPRTWHASGVNTTGAPRRGWISSWLPRTARWDPSLAPRHSLAGRMEPGKPVDGTDLLWSAS